MLPTINAFDKPVADAFTPHNALRLAQQRIIPIGVLFQPGERSRKAVATRFSQAAPLGIAGLRDRYPDAAGQWHGSHTMLTFNADQDPFFRD